MSYSYNEQTAYSAECSPNYQPSVGGSHHQHYSSSSRHHHAGGANELVGLSHQYNTADQVASDLLQLNRSSAGAATASYDLSGDLSLSGGAQVSANAYDSGLSYQQSSAAGASFQSQSYTASSSAAAAGSATLLSQVEQAILRSNVPIDINETEEITVNGQRGIWANKSEVVNWRGVIPISQYQINEDSNPEIITKRSSQQVEYIQELAIRYLRPPTPPAPGEIIITQEVNTLAPPAPPLIIRQQPARPTTPEPLVIREAPPQPPCQVGRKVITISGKRLPPPPRKVIIERLAPLPSKPQSVIVERWLPYSQVKRRVIFQKSNDRDPVIMKPRNVVIQWEAPRVNIKKEIKYLGVIRANPVEYVQRYGTSLKTSRELPEFVLDIKTPEGIVLAADYKYNSLHELEGEVAALKLVDLDREGLSEYRSYLQRLGIQYVGATNINSAAAQLTTSQVNISAQSYSTGGAVAGGSYSSAHNHNNAAAYSSASGYEASVGNYGSGSYENSFGYASQHAGGQLGARDVIAEIFSQVDRDRSGRISVSEAESLLLRLNSRLNRHYGENEVRAFFQALDVNRDNSIDLREFRAAFERLV